MWRKEAGAAWWWRSFFKVFFLQGVILWIVAAPLLAAQISAQPNHLTWLDYLAVPVWLIGFFFEAVGDWQLVRFKANPVNKGKVLQTGVWRYTRHPNYFRRRDAVVGVLSRRAGGWRLVDNLQPDHHDDLADARIGCDTAGEILEGNETRLQRVRRNDKRIYSLVSAP